MHLYQIQSQLYKKLKLFILRFDVHETSMYIKLNLNTKMNKTLVCLIIILDSQDGNAVDVGENIHLMNLLYL